MWFVYLLENSKDNIYIGFTQNIEKRLIRHNRFKGLLWTQGRGEWKLIYSETFESKREAMQREKK